MFVLFSLSAAEPCPQTSCLQAYPACLVQANHACFPYGTFATCALRRRDFLSAYYYMTHATMKCTQGNQLKQTSNTTSYKQGTIKLLDKGSCADSSVAKDRLSDAGGLSFESHTGWIMGKSIPSLWRDKRPAIKSPWPPEHH